MSALLKRLLATVADQPSSFCRSPSQSISGWKAIGVFFGVLLFFGIISHAAPASAQLFKNVESQVTTIFGNNIDASIIAFMFGVLRIVIWVTAVGFIFFAVYQAQRGEQWQPLMQNAFIVIAAVVIVEGMSKLFFGGTVGT
ncbi:hypothetical protein [Leptolyngbya sp. BC1307]|uniref:hypothetical protein n=1 Tax=Leptolyngbya sp. BC1307 TaxID=2029589 RepID=UPI000EFB3F32|nr:hypothetical protein [Leptolyngbya sp. BC1307]